MPMNRHRQWWENRKSRMGLKPSAKPPPWDPSTPWYTTPPTSPPEPEMMEYVIQFQDEVSRKMHLGNPAERKQATELSTVISRWLAAARRLYHERIVIQNTDPSDDFSTTDGVIRAAAKCIGRLRKQLYDLGVTIDARDEAVGEELQRRSTVEINRRARRMLGSRAR